MDDITILIGQFNNYNQLHGIGKKFTPYCLNEGQFKYNQLCGFGRKLSVAQGFGKIEPGEGIYAAGYWINDEHLMGYGKRYRKRHKVKGYWDDASFVWGDPVSKA